MTAWHLTPSCWEAGVIWEIWEMAGENVTTEEIKNEILLRTDKEGRTAWHLAECGGQADVMQEIWEMDKEKLTTEETVK
jgi:hypothetical protein